MRPRRQAKQKLGRTFNSDKLGGIAFTPSFCFAFKIPDDVAASTMYMNFTQKKIVAFSLVHKVDIFREDHSLDLT